MPTTTASATERLATLRAEERDLNARLANARATLGDAVARDVPPDEYAQARAAVRDVTERLDAITAALPSLEVSAKREAVEQEQAELVRLQQAFEQADAELSASFVELEREVHTFSAEVFLPQREAQEALYNRANGLFMALERARGKRGVRPDDYVPRPSFFARDRDYDMVRLYKLLRGYASAPAFEAT